MTNFLSEFADGGPGARSVARDPRVLLLVATSIVLCSFFVRGFTGLLLLQTYLLVLCRHAGLSIVRLARSLRGLAFFFVLIVAINAYFVPGRALLGLSFLSVEGCIAGVFYSFRVLVLYVTLRLFVAVVPPERLAAAVAAILGPVAPRLARRIALYGFLSLGFLPLFADEYQRIRTAQSFRGGGMHGSFFDKVRGVQLIIVPLIVSAIHRSDQLAVAVELRGIRASIGQLYALPRPTAYDVVFGMVSIGIVFTAVLGL